MNENRDLLLAQFTPVASITDCSSDAICIVRHQISGRLLIQKRLTQYDRSVFEALKLLPAQPHLPKIHALVEADGVLTVIEDYIHGQTLESMLLGGHTFTEKEVLHITEGLCDALEVLHHLTPPIIHRDIKPSNIMLSADNVVKLIDFNASRFTKIAAHEDTVKLGTAGYASPEQFGFRQSDARSDIYALGVVMNVLLTGKMPNEQTTEGALKRIILRCVELQPEKRYQSVTSLKRALSLLSAKKAEPQATPTTSYALPGFRSNNPSHMLLALLFYGFIIFFSIESGTTMTNYALVFWDPLFLMATFLTITLFLCNYRNIWRFLPLMRSKNFVLNLIGGGLYSFLILVLYVLLSMLMVQIFK